MPKRLLHVVIFILVTCQIGCGGGSVKVSEEPDKAGLENMDKFMRAYMDFCAKNNSAPRSLKDLEPFLKKYGDPQALSKSPNDGQPYVVHWGYNPNLYDSAEGAAPVVAYEKQGKDGQRWVFRADGVFKLSVEELKNSVFPPGFKPQF